MAGNGFVALKLDATQGKEINKIFKTAGLKCLTPSKYHVTVMYDESDPEIELLKNSKSYTATITGVERLGKKGAKYEAIALILKSPEIEKRHKELKNAGFKHKYPDIKVHMSIFRYDEDALWENTNVNHVCNIANLSTHYYKVHSFYNTLRVNLGSKEPN